MRVILRDITKKFGTFVAVDNLNLNIHDGEFVALLGPSGCGKSTTLLMLAGIYKPDKGKIIFGNKNVTHELPKDRNVGMCFQNYALYPHMTVFENIAFPLKLRKMPRDIIVDFRKLSFLYYQALSRGQLFFYLHFSSLRK